MRENKVNIIPIVDERTQDHFVCSDQHPNVEIAESDPTLYTNYLKFGVWHDLFGLSMAKQWLDTGYMDHTDRIGGDFYLGKILVSNGERTALVDLPDAMKFEPSEDDSPSKSTLTCNNVSIGTLIGETEDKAKCVIDIHGTIDHEKGELEVSYQLIENQSGYEPIGFDIIGSRINSNR